MTAINKALQAVTLGEVQSFENPQITPLLASAAGAADYLTLAEAQVGACFVIDGKICGLELFDVSDTCGKLIPKLIRTHALDAIEDRQ